MLKKFLNKVFISIVIGITVFCTLPSPVVNAAAVAEVKWVTASQTFQAGTTSGIMTIQTVDSLGNAANVTTDKIVNLSSNSTSGRFDIVQGGTFNGSITSVTILAGTNTVSFYYKDNFVGKVEIIINIPGERWPTPIQLQTITPRVPSVTTDSIGTITTTGAVASGTITDTGSPKASSYGVCWSTNPNPSTINSKINKGAVSTTGAFTANITGLTPFTKYYVRAYATNTGGTAYGAELNFTTSSTLPAISTLAASGIGITSATVSGNLTSLGGPSPSQHGFVWSTAHMPTLSDNKTLEGPTSTLGKFSSIIAGLSPYTTYHVRAYATNLAGTVYGNDVSFTTNPQLPTITTNAVTNILVAQATASGNLASLGIPAPTQHGFVWNVATNPTLADNHTSYGATNSTGTFSGNITGLASNTIYYVKAYATNLAGTVYGNEVSFTTSPVLPAVMTLPVTGVATTSATAQGTIISLGNPIPSQHGFVWNTTGNATIADSKTVKGAASTTGNYSSFLSGLTSYTTYYLRAYATNTAGTVYGNEIIFTTSPLAPVISTELVSSITTNSANITGKITSLGNPAPSQHGFVWSTATNPAVSDNKTIQGPANTTGNFSSLLSGLTPNTTYYVRSYATSAAGTFYGNQLSFTTNPIAPAVTTQATTNVSATTATGHGTLVTLGVPNPSQYGFVWNVATGPNLTNNVTNLGAAASTGNYSGNITGLLPNTTYYLRSYAQNTAGTVYGNEVSFTTLPQLPSVSTQAVSGITTGNATMNGTILTLGSPPPSQHGFVWSTTTNPTAADSVIPLGAINATGTFQNTVTGLNPGVTYYVKSYAINTAGTVYGNEVSFTTLSILPVLTSQSSTSITTTSATLHATIVSLGLPAPTQYGFVWSTTPNPTVLDSKINLGAANITGLFQSNISGLSPSTTYYVKAYAINAAGTVYGNQTSFTTGTPTAPPPPPPPSDPPVTDPDPEGDPEPVEDPEPVIDPDPEDDPEPEDTLVPDEEPVQEEPGEGDLYITSNDLNLGLFIPASNNGTGTLSASQVKISIANKEEIACPHCTCMVGQVYDIDLGEIDLTTETVMTFKYEEDELLPGIQERDLYVAVSEDDGQTWERLLGCTVFEDDNYITVPVGSFSMFTIMAGIEGLPFSFKNLEIYPEIVSSGHQVEISCLIENHSCQDAKETITLKVNGKDGENKEIVLNAGGVSGIEFSTRKWSAGVYQVTVGNLTGSFTVVESSMMYLWLLLIPFFIGALLAFFWKRYQVVTVTVSQVSDTSVLLHGQLKTRLGARFDIRGFDFGETDRYGQEIVIHEIYKNLTYQITIQGLQSGTEYHVRAKGHGKNRWYYGNDVTFTTM